LEKLHGHFREALTIEIVRNKRIVVRIWKKHLLIPIILGTFMDLFAGDPDPEISLEYQVKAAFLYKFIKFVDWPGDAFSDTNRTVTIGVLGKGPINQALDLIAGKEVKRHRLVIKHFDKPQDLHYCHVLFIGQSEKPYLKDVMNILNGSSTLTVSEIEEFANYGGMINFIIVRNRIGFEINLNAAEKKRLKINSKLLRLAKIVGAHISND